MTRETRLERAGLGGSCNAVSHDRNAMSRDRNAVGHDRNAASRVRETVTDARKSASDSRKSASDARNAAAVRAWRTVAGKGLLTAISLVLVASFTVVRVGAATAESEVRAAVEQAFRQLKSGDYGGLYDALPTASQRRITREGFARSLERARGMYELDRLEVGAVRVAGELAAVDSVVYGRARVPFEGEGKIVMRQYLIREGGRWRVTTGDASTVRPLLAANPAFARRYPLTRPRLYVKRDGRWVEMTQPPPRR